MSDFHSTPCRVLLVTARYVPEIGGTELHTSELAERLSRAGHCVTVLTTDRTGMLARQERVGSVLVHRVRAWPRHRDYYLAPSLYRAIRGAECDIMHIQGYHTLVAPLAMVAAIRNQTPYVLAFHSGGHSSRLRQLLRGPQIRIMGPLLRRAKLLIAGSPEEQKYFAGKLRWPPEHIVQIPVTHALDHGELLSGMPPEFDIPRIVSVGRLEEYKGHHLVIAAMPHLLAVEPTAHLHIVGEGAYEARLRRLVDNLGLGNAVTIGSIPIDRRTEMAQLLAHASVAVSLSSYESAGIAIREALAVHRKVLVSNALGFDDIRNQEGVYTVKLPAPPERIATALANALRAPDPAPEEPSITWDEVTDRFRAIYADSLRVAP
jgi:glycosyltransferase involved in cell wall biosynthesis